jgi:hypothetical protein
MIFSKEYFSKEMATTMCPTASADLLSQILF